MDTNRILSELRAQRTTIDRAISAIEAIGSDGAIRRQTFKTASVVPKKRRMSTAARKRLSDLLKKRWAQGKMGRAKARSTTARVKAAPVNKKTRTGGISAAGRKRISELMKKRWAERRKAKAAV